MIVAMLAYGRQPYRGVASLSPVIRVRVIISACVAIDMSHHKGSAIKWLVNIYLFQIHVTLRNVHESRGYFFMKVCKNTEIILAEHLGYFHL